MTALVGDGKMIVILLVFVFVGLLAVLVFSLVSYGGVGLELIDGSTLRYCSLSGGVCTGV